MNVAVSSVGGVSFDVYSLAVNKVCVCIVVHTWHGVMSTHNHCVWRSHVMTLNGMCFDRINLTSLCGLPNECCEHNTILPPGQVEIRPVQVRGSVGDIVNITCIVGTVSTSSTLLLTAQNVQLTPNFTDVQTDRVVFGYGPLTAEDDNRPVICSFGTMEAEGVISVLCE